MMRKRWALAAVVALALLAAACGGGDDSNSDRDSTSSSSGQTASTPLAGQVAGGTTATAQTATIKRGGTLIRALSTNPKIFDPMQYTDTDSGVIIDNVFETLVKYDEQVKPQPWLAEKIDQPDDTTYVFTLRKGVKFHDGTEMDAEAVKFSVDRVREFKTGSAYVEAQQVVESTVVDKYTYRMKIKEPNTPFWIQLAGRLGSIVSPTAVRAAGDEKFGAAPVGTGPFRFKEFKSDSSARVEKFEGYWRVGQDGRPLPYLDAIEFRIITESANRLTALQNGDVHEAAVSEQDLKIVQKDTNLQWKQQPAFSWTSFLLTNTKPPFDNKALRQSLYYALDRQEIIDVIFEGNRTLANGPIPLPFAWAIDPAYVAYPPKGDLSKAREKLAEGGKPQGFEFTYYGVSGDSVGQRLAELIQAQLARAGIKMNIELADFNGVVIPKSRAQEPGAFAISFSCGFDPDPCIASRFLGGNSFNYMGYNNPRLDALILQARRAKTVEERGAIYKQAQPILMEDAPAVILAYGVTRFTGSKRVQGWAFTPRSSTGQSEWWLQ